MANAVPISGKRKAAVIVEEPVAAPRETTLADIPEHHKAAAEAAIAAGKRVEVTPKGNLRIYAAE